MNNDIINIGVWALRFLQHELGGAVAPSYGSSISSCFINLQNVFYRVCNSLHSYHKCSSPPSPITSPAFVFVCERGLWLEAEIWTFRNYPSLKTSEKDTRWLEYLKRAKSIPGERLNMAERMLMYLQFWVLYLEMTWVISAPYWKKLLPSIELYLCK